MSNRKVWLDPNGHVIKTRGAEDIARCPFQIGIVSTGLIFHGAPEADALAERRFGTVVLDEAHRARRARGITVKGDEPNNLLKFMRKIAGLSEARDLRHGNPRSRPNVEELWDLLEVLNQGADHVLGRDFSAWRQCRNALPILTGEKLVDNEGEAWALIRNPFAAAPRQMPLFDHIRSD